MFFHLKRKLNLREYFTVMETAVIYGVKVVIVVSLCHLTKFKFSLILTSEKITN